MLFFYLHLHKIPPIIIARFYSCSSSLRKPRTFFSFSCSGFKIRIASFNYIIYCTITKLWLHDAISKCISSKIRITNGLWFNCCIEKWSVPYCLNIKYTQVYLYFMTLWLNIFWGITMYKIDMLIWIEQLQKFYLSAEDPGNFFSLCFLQLKYTCIRQVYYWHFYILVHL